MRTRLYRFFLFALFAASVPVHADEIGFDDLPAGETLAPAPTSAPELLQSCRDRLPAEPVRLTGWVRRRRARGIVEKEFNYTAELRWADETPTVRYDLTSTSGEPLFTATFRHAAGATEMALESGPDHEPVEPPAWNSDILGTDVTWLYLSMDFLHWERAELAGEAKVKGRLCDLVEVYPPTPLPGCRKVRLWVDRETRMFLQVQEISEEGKVQRQLWVRSVKKMGDRWMVQDMEVETRGAGRRTRLHVLTCE